MMPALETLMGGTPPSGDGGAKWRIKPGGAH
jgi:hypothetical protein